MIGNLATSRYLVLFSRCENEIKNLKEFLTFPGIDGA
jgi:hypothetical protein